MTAIGVVGIRNIKRTALEKARDILLCVFCVLASLIMAVGISIAIYTLSELGQAAGYTKQMEPEDCETVRRPECSPVVED